MARHASEVLQEIPEKDDTLIVEIYLKSRKFESKIQVPLFCSKQEREDFINSWLDLMQAGLKTGGARD